MNCKTFIILASLSQVHPVHANLMECRNGSILVTKCRLTIADISSPLGSPVFGTYETKYDVAYRFLCPGEKTVFGFKAGNDDSFVSLESSESVQMASIVGSTALRTYDPDPKTTYNSSFKKQCSLVVDSIDLSPSLAETMKWREDAQQQYKILRLAYNVYLIVVNMEDISEWDKDQIAAVSRAIAAIIDDRILKHGVVAEAAKPKDAFVSPKKYLQNLKAADPEISEEELNDHSERYLAFLGGDTLDLITLLYFTDSIVKNRPVGTNPTIGDAIEASKNATSLREKAKKELVKEHQLAIAMLERAKKYQVQISKELEKLANDIPTISGE